MLRTRRKGYAPYKFEIEMIRKGLFDAQLKEKIPSGSEVGRQMLDASDEGENFMERLSMRIPENAAVILKGII